MQSSREQQGEIRKPSSVTKEKKQERNRIGKTRDLFKIQGNISCKDGHNKGQKRYGPNRSRRYSEEVARIKRRNMQRNLYDQTHDGVITHLEPDILEC